MGDAIQFVPRADRDAIENIASFVELAANKLSAFGGKESWANDKWKEGTTVVVFATKTAPLDAYSYTPMADPFKQFAKGYVKYQFSHRPTKHLGPMIQALRCLEAGLIAVTSRAEIQLINIAVLDVSATKCREFYRSADVQCQTGRHLKAIVDFVRENRMAPSMGQWKSPFKKPAILTEDLGPEGKAHRDSKLPSNAVMLMVADLFAQASDVESRYFTSIFILLMATPSRISEVLRLPIDCIQWEPDNDGVPQMYLRWYAAKGKGAIKKWVVPAMHDAVLEAVRRLTAIGAPARAAARFAFDHPREFLPHEGCLVSPAMAESRALSPHEFCAALGLKCHGSGARKDGSDAWSRVSSSKPFRMLIRQGRTSYADLASVVTQVYCGRAWPFVDEDKRVEAWNALCLHRENEFRQDCAVKHFSWRLAGQTEVNSRMSSDKGLSLFERAGWTNADGSDINLSTHQLRHWLSTMCERAGMDDYTLAQWAGRAKVSDNRHYDHRTPEERLSEARAILKVEQPPLLDRIKARQPVTYEELGVDRLGTAKATLYGMCVHDYAMAPCEKQRECMTCKEHVCIKGDHVSLDRIKLLEAQTELLLKRAQDAHEEGIFGADRWVDNHKWKLAHTKAIRITLERDDVLDGTLVRIPEGHDPSPVRRALMDLGVLDAAGPEPTAISLSTPLLPGNGHAETDHH
jgi:hypothetical protein